MPIILNGLRKIYWWLLPPTCIFCHYPSTLPYDICEPCLNELPMLTQNCPRCANTLTTTATQDVVCGACLKESPPFDATYALYTYQTPITKLIMELKFQHKLVNARVLGELMANMIQTAWYHNKPLPDMIIPVPLHPKRLRERGFNQALEIARPISRLLKLPVQSTNCIRLKHTTAQALLPAEKRIQNMKNAFLIKEDLTGRHVAILDDVITTGHTLMELSRVLKKAGASRIDIWCCAKTPRLW